MYLLMYEELYGEKTFDLIFVSRRGYKKYQKGKNSGISIFSQHYVSKYLVILDLCNKIKSYF